MRDYTYCRQGEMKTYLKGRKPVFCHVTVITNDTEKILKCSRGANLMALLAAEGVFFDAPCGGKGICGKCKVVIDPPTEATKEQEKFITLPQLASGIRLACMTIVEQDCTVKIKDTATAVIKTGGIMPEFTLMPMVQKQCVTLHAPTLSDQSSWELRLKNALACELTLDIGQLRALETAVKDGLAVTVSRYNDICLNIEGGDTTRRHYGIAVDIGTTTVVAYLYDLTSGRCMDIISSLNEQKSFGADVISRIDYATQTADGLSVLGAHIENQITLMAKQLLDRNSIGYNDLCIMTFAGNTTMMHLLCKIAPAGIAVSPFIPVMTQGRLIYAGEIGIGINPHCAAYLLPCVSAYVGADTVAAMAACGMEKAQKALLIDIGTNGEIVLRADQRLIACSTAAGPAFEGANIRCGVGGIEGAISAVKWESGRICYTTIGEKKPIGICGSGLIDAVGVLAELGVIDETGRMVDADEIDNPYLLERLTEIDGQNAFVIAEDIVLTAKDIREVQLAKAAIAAGIRTLLNEAGLAVEALDTVYLAGGFGSYINRDSAIKIGLLPHEVKDKIVVCGNAAGSGAAAVMCSGQMARNAGLLQGRCEYIELSTSARFQQWYVDCMMF